MSDSAKTTLPGTLSVLDVVALTVGVVVGSSIFSNPTPVAASVGSFGGVLFVWGLGGVVSLIGAVCYAELASAYPHAGGDYHYFQRAFGDWMAFLFAWARLAVIQTGSIVFIAFVFGDYASQLFSLGTYSSALYAALAIVFFTILNAEGVRLGKTTQQVLTAATVLGLLLIIGAGLFFAPESVASGSPDASAGWLSSSQLGGAMIFVLYTYGGWNEAAYVSGELRDVKQNMVRALLISIGIITTLYLLVNWAYLNGLGVEGVSNADAVAADLMRATLGEPGAIVLSVLVAVAALSSTNATIFTGARTSFALGRDTSLFSILGVWNERADTPANALWVQCGVSLALVGVGAATRQGFQSMVDYTAPVFWLFFLATGVSLFVLRRTEPEADRPFQVPLYPLTPILFCLASGYMLWSSLAYADIGALLGAGVLLAGVPLLWFREESSN
jgi:APA family basic amino acid/polyamine antiporter